MKTKSILIILAFTAGEILKDIFKMSKERIKEIENTLLAIRKGWCGFNSEQIKELQEELIELKQEEKKVYVRVCTR